METGMERPLPHNHGNNGVVQNIFCLSPGTWKARCLSVFLGQLCAIASWLILLIDLKLQESYHVNIYPVEDILAYFVFGAAFTISIACSKAPFAENGQLCNFAKTRGWQYFLMALCYVESLHITRKAYPHTILSSFEISSGFVILSVILSSYVILKVRFGALHYAAVFICLLGSSCFLFVNISSSYPFTSLRELVVHEVLLFYVVQFIYGISLVWMQCLVCRFGPVETIGSLCFSGTAISGFNMVVFEYEDVTKIIATISTASHLKTVLSLLLAIVLISLIYYVALIYILKLNGAVMTVLSALTFDFYIILLYGFYLSHYFVYQLLGFILLLTGLVLYSSKPVTKTVVSQHLHLEAVKRSGAEEQSRV